TGTEKAAAEINARSTRLPIALDQTVIDSQNDLIGAFERAGVLPESFDFADQVDVPFDDSNPTSNEGQIMPTTFSPVALRPIHAQAPTPITAVAGLVDGKPTSMIVASFIGLSLDPPLVGVSIQDTSTTWPRLRQAGCIGISALAAEHAG